MRRKIFSIWSVLLVLVVSIAVLVLGCTPAEGCTIEFKAKLGDEPWEGNVSYTLTGPGAAAAPITGTEVPDSFTVECGEWTIEYIEGGPDGAYLVDITSSGTVGKITFTFNFELEQDASIEFLTWTINGYPVEPNIPEEPYYVTCGDIIDVHLKQHVAGCRGEEVRVEEYSVLELCHTGGYIDWFGLHVVDDWDAVVKTPAPIEKEFQALLLYGASIEYCDWFETWDIEPTEPPECWPFELETVWLLEKCTDYEKSINVARIGECLNPEGPTPVLVELFLDIMEPVHATLVATAEVELVDDDEANLDNNVAVSPTLYIVIVPEGP